MEKCDSDQCSTAKSENTGECCDMPEKLLALADEAWFEVLKEKMKAEISTTCGDRLDKLAKLVTETNQDKWMHTIQGKVKCEEYKENLKAMFAGKCDK